MPQTGAPVPPPRPIEPDEAYHEFRGPGDVLRDKTEQHARDMLAEAHWDRKTGSAPAAQVHHDGKLHNPRASMSIELPPAGAQEKKPVGPPLRKT